MEQILVVLGITFFVMISPGPDMVLVTRNTLIGGRAAGLQTSLGILTGNFVHMAYCALGIGWLISQSILAFSALKLLGAAYLIYLGVMSFRGGHQSLEIEAEGAATRRLHTRKTWFLQGFVNNLLNPKGTLFYLGVFTVVITPETTLGMTAFLVLCMTFVSASFWVVFVHALDRPFVRTFLETSQRSVNRVFGVLLVGLGLRVATMER
jgi:RhtB (resistance to homoserine/threonine) family protein